MLRPIYAQPALKIVADILPVVNTAIDNANKLLTVVTDLGMIDHKSQLTNDAKPNFFITLTFFL